MKLVSLLAAATLAASLTAQNCSTLTVSGGAPNPNLSFSVSGADAMSPVVIVIGDTLGTTTLNFGSATLILGLAQPFSPIGGGFSNAAGDATVNIRIPRRITPMDLHGQAVTVDLAGLPTTFDFCTSNTVSFHIG